jgi:hypothetical protein
MTGHDTIQTGQQAQSPPQKECSFEQLTGTILLHHRYLPSYTNTLPSQLLPVFIRVEFTNQALLLSHC